MKLRISERTALKYRHHIHMEGNRIPSMPFFHTLQGMNPVTLSPHPV